MKLALLSGASPKTCGVGPVVRLTEGDYSIHVQGKTDSELALCVDGVIDPLHLIDRAGFCTDKPVRVQVMFTKRGTESYINVLAENVNG